MNRRRLGALIAALPLTVLALSGAATPPAPAALTYHGMFDSAVRSGDCTPGAVSGTWNVLVPDRAAGVAVVFVQIKLDNRLHALWRWDFQLDTAATGATLQASKELVWPVDPPVTDHLTVTVADGEFAYHLDSEFLGCDVTFSGPQLS